MSASFRTLSLCIVASLSVNYSLARMRMQRETAHHPCGPVLLLGDHCCDRASIASQAADDMALQRGASRERACVRSAHDLMMDYGALKHECFDGGIGIDGSKKVGKVLRL